MTQEHNGPGHSSSWVLLMFPNAWKTGRVWSMSSHTHNAHILLLMSQRALLLFLSPKSTLEKSPPIFSLCSLDVVNPPAGKTGVLDQSIWYCLFPFAHTQLCYGWHVTKVRAWYETRRLSMTLVYVTTCTGVANQKKNRSLQCQSHT